MNTLTETTRDAATGDSVALELWQALSAAHASLQARLETPEQTCQVLASDTVAVLLPLAEADGGRLRMHELARRSHLTPSGLTRRVDRLEEDGLVARESCPGDRRGAFCSLTDAGRTALTAALPHHAGRLDDFIRDRLSADATERLIALLEQLATATHQEQDSN